MGEKEFKAGDFWEKRLSRKHGLHGVGYAKVGAPFNYWAYKVRASVFDREVKACLADALPAARLLDIGSGTGFYLDRWQQLGVKNPEGLDITRVAVERLKAHFPELTIHLADIGEKNHALVAQLNSYDIISCMDVLFHIVDDNRFKQALHNISDLLKPGGWFVYSDNFVHGNTFRKAHQVSHTYDDLMQWLSEAGFELVVRKPFMVLTNYPVDSKHPLLHAWWYLLENSHALIKPLGHLSGPLLYRIDRLLTGKLKEGPSSEFVILRKRK